MKLKNLLASAAVALSLTVSAQEDVTSQYLTNADLKSLDGWYIDKSFGGNGYTDWRNNGDVPVIEFYHSWSTNAGIPIGNQKNFQLSQTVTLPAGNYRIAVNAFYREGNGTGANDKAYIFAGEKTQNVIGLSSAGVASYTGSTDLYKAANAFSRGDFSNEFDFTVETEQEITLGFRGYIDTYCSWCILGPVKLYKYSLEAYLNDYQTKLDAANAIKDKPMAKDAKDKLLAAMVDKTTLATIVAIQEAARTLNTAIQEANGSIAEYEGYKAMYDKVMALDADGQAEFQKQDPDFLPHFTAGTVTAADVTPFQTAYIAAVKAQTTPGSDFTALITNPEINGSDGWSIEKPIAGNGPMLNGNSFEYWSYTLGRGAFDYYQTINGLPLGQYTISATMMNDQAESAAAFVPAAGVYAQTADGTVMAVVDTYADGQALAALKEYTTEAIMVNDGRLRIGVKNANPDNTMPARWFVADNFRLTYQGVDLTDFQHRLDELILAANSMADAEMNKDVADRLWNVADNAANCPYKAEALNTAINNLSEAIEDAKASIETYKELKAIAAKAAALAGDDAAAAYADALKAYTDRTATETETAMAAYKAAMKQAEPVSDITDLAGHGLEPNDASTAESVWVGANKYVTETYCPQSPGSPERYYEHPTTGTVIVQTITGLKKGSYEVTLKGGARYTPGRGIEGEGGSDRSCFFANDAIKSIEVLEDEYIKDGEMDVETLVCNVTEEGILKFGIQNITEGANWFVCDIVSIKYISGDYLYVEPTLQVSEAQYATFVCPFDIQLPEGVTAYTIESVGAKNELQMTETGTTLPANTPVVLYSETPVEKTYTGVSKAEGKYAKTGILYGVYEESEITEGYVLQKQTVDTEDGQEDKIAFFRVNDAIKVPAYKAYLSLKGLDTDTEIKWFGIGNHDGDISEDDVPLAVDSIRALTTGNAVIYNADGIRQDKLQKGMNIIMVNGQTQKVLVK